MYFVVLISFSVIFPKTLLDKPNNQAFPVEIGIPINSKSANDNVTDFELVAVMTEVSFVFNIVDNTL